MNKYSWLFLLIIQPFLFGWMGCGVPLYTITFSGTADAVLSGATVTYQRLSPALGYVNKTLTTTITEKDGTFSFRLSERTNSSADNYHITINNPPAGQKCVVVNGYGNVPDKKETVSVTATCTTETVSVGGFIQSTSAGLDVTLSLTGNSTTSEVFSTNGSFAFVDDMPSVEGGAYYLVEATSHPDGHHCYVTENATGTATADITNVKVECRRVHYLFQSESAMPYLTSRSEVDAVCETAFNNLSTLDSTTCTSVRAFVSMSRRDTIRQMPRNFGVNRDQAIYFRSNNKVAGVDWRSLLDGRIDTASPLEDWWSGSEPGGSYYRNCDHWSRSAGNEEPGYGKKLESDGDWMSDALVGNRRCGNASLYYTCLCLAPALAKKYFVSFTLSGLDDGESVILSLNTNAEQGTYSTNGRNSFSTEFDLDDDYEVTVSQNPTGKTCTITNGNGVIAGNVTDMMISCAVPAVTSYSVGFTVTGLAANQSVGVTLNGTETLTITADGASTFTTLVENNSAYVVTVSTHPGNQACTVGSGSGTIAADVSDVTITCETAQFLYKTATTYDGDLGGRTGADAKCNTDKPSDLVCAGGVRAFLAANSIDSISDFPTSITFSQTLPIYNESTNLRLATGWTDLLDGVIENAASTTQWWSGTTDTGIVSANCNDFSSDSEAVFQGNVGTANATGTGWMHDGSAESCSTTLPLLCFCYQ